jgi:hypothetical protein
MKRLPLVLTIAGTLPFVALSVPVSMEAFPDPRPIIHVLLTYAAVIVSFIGGAHWGIAVTQYGNNRRIANLLIVQSVWPSLVAWGALLHVGIHIQLLVMTLLYTFMWAIDSLLYNNAIIPQWFFNLRCIITPIVVVSLYVAYFGLI